MRFQFLIVLLTIASDIGQSCLGLRAFVPVCISTPWYTFTPPVQLAPKTIVPASDIPVPIMPGIVDNCAKFELVGGGLRVDAITSDNNIILDDFVSWNTLVKKDDPVLWDGYWVCIGV